MDNQIKIKKYYYEISWFVTDRWFRVLEFSLVLGLLSYFSKITNNIVLKMVFYISWGLLWYWFLDLGEYFFELINSKNKLNRRKKIIIQLLSGLAIMLIYLTINYVANVIVLQQNN